MIFMPSPLEILMAVRLEMHMGRPLLPALEQVLKVRQDSYSRALKNWINRRLAGQSIYQAFEALEDLGSTPGRRSLVLAFEKGLQGAPLDDVLGDLEREYFFLAEHGFEKHLQLLPLKLLVPLMTLIFPGVFLLVAGPLLFALSSGL